ncbi:MAG: sensor histidine kinase [Flavobacteriales bacterium]|nr:sensor histidine kinase [Flavobacteriales bacterium]MDW8431659.1 sensor histidine kinase [Flavobacteriales bacterium]
MLRLLSKMFKIDISLRAGLLFLFFYGLKFLWATPADSLERIQALQREGNAFFKKANYVEALSRFFQALKLSEALGHRVYEAVSSKNIAIVFLETEKYPEAEKFALKAVHLLENENAPGYLGDAYNTLANVYYDTRRDAQAVPYYHKALQLWEQVGDSLGLFSGYKNLGAVHYEMGQHKKGLSIMRKCLRYLPAIRDSSSWFSAYMTLGEAYVYDGQLEEGKKHLDAAARYLPFTKAINKFEDYYYALYFYFKKKKEYVHALEAHELYHQFRDSIINVHENQQLFELNTRYETEKKEARIAFQEKIIAQEKKARRLWAAATSATALLLSALFVIFRQRQMRKTEKLLQQQHEKSVQEIFQAEQNERIRIARDLHDSIGQKLAVIRMLMPPHNQEPKLEKMHRYLEETAQEVREISHNLIPEILNFGLVKAIQSLVDRIHSTEKIQVAFHAEEALNKLTLPRETELSLYRIVQEILSNIIRHARTERIQVNLSLEGHEVHIRIEDSGVGFDTEKIDESRGIGWKNIFARIRLVNGKIRIHSEKNKGSQFLISIPVM